MSTKVYILVYEGSPLDYAEYRHTALHFMFPRGLTTTLHVVGTQGLFQFEEDIDQDPHEGGKLVHTIAVGELISSINAAALKKVVSATPIKNGRDDLEWNCQNWVGDALAGLVERGYLSEPQRATAIDKMLDACLEAKDE
ncbi:hypothetical protein EYZ11_002902 [Aspergillus tanneri]|uniref:Uncharacterized protein n=1 Tax=Aspergillus tanneri TaxID=1220188 RepID=A0A4S3JPQ6_9EURO|nr:uncharacterized protein ATNIH1004_011260 [Aspergillus tanneri]KAA8642316.1 hypothetical protein ATNIH1004_011260 [Aspergillus tanneri]THC97612.1 hypothetical protein EYZ11_002902 [Aspergillus tanneri]